MLDQVLLDHICIMLMWVILNINITSGSNPTSMAQHLLKRLYKLLMPQYCFKTLFSDLFNYHLISNYLSACYVFIMCLPMGVFETYIPLFAGKIFRPTVSVPNTLGYTGLRLRCGMYTHQIFIYLL